MCSSVCSLGPRQPCRRWCAKKKGFDADEPHDRALGRSRGGFGTKLHLVVDVKHEVSLGYRITDTKAADNEILPEVLSEARANLQAAEAARVKEDIRVALQITSEKLALIQSRIQAGRERR